MPIMVAGYLLLCLTVALLGRGRRIGVFGYFLLAVLFTPIITLVFLLVSRIDQSPVRSLRVKVCKVCKKENAEMAGMRYCPACGRAI